MVITFFARAQRAVIGPVSSDSVRSFYMTNWVGVSVPVAYTEHCIYQKIGDTIMYTTPTVSPTVMSYLVTISNLVPSTQYRFANVINAGGVHDTSAFETFTTPALQPLSITNITPDTSVFPIRTRFHFDLGGGYAVNASCFVNGNPLNQTSIIRLVGSGDTSIVMTGYSTRLAMYTSNFVYASVVGTISGISPDSFFAFANYTVPGLRSSTFGTPSVAQYQDSLVFSNSVVGGNDFPITLKMIFYDSTRFTSSTSTQVILRDSAFTNTYRSLATASGYSLNLIKTSSAGADTLIIGAHTLQVLPPNIIHASVDTMYATLTSTFINVSATTSGVWSGSTSRIFIKYFVGGYPRFIYDIPFVGSRTTQLGPLTNLNLNPGSNTIWVYITNNAGLTDSFQYTFTLPRLPTLTAPTWTNLLVQSQIMLEVVGIQVTPPINDPLDVFALNNTDGTSYTDTFWFPNLQNVTSQIFLNDSIINLIGNTKYNVRIGVRDMYGQTAINSQVISGTTLAPTQPICTISGVGYVFDSISFLVNGSGNGYVIDLTNAMYSASNPNTTISQLTPLILGPGNFGFLRFALPDQNLVWGAEYEIRSTVRVHTDQSNPYATSFLFNLTPLGMEQVDPFNSKELHMVAYDLLGQQLLEHSLPAVQIESALKEKGFHGIVIMRPIDEGWFNRIGGKKIVIGD